MVICLGKIKGVAMKIVIDAIKKIYDKQNIQKHIIFLILVTIFTTLSALYDIKTGQADTWKQNLFDWTLSILIAIYSVQFLHDCFKDPTSVILPFWSKIELRAIPGQIVLSIVWAVYLFIVGILTLIWYAVTDDLILPVIIAILITGFLPYIYYSYIKFAKEFSLHKTMSLIFISKYIKKSFKPTMLVYLQYILTFIILFVIYILLYFLASLVGIAELFQIADNYYLFDIITSAFFEYALNLLFFFLLPYSLLQIFLYKIDTPNVIEVKDENEELTQE